MATIIRKVADLVHIAAGKYTVVVERNKRVTITETATGRTNTFTMGDMAEYDSYNLSYFGPIIGITDKRVRIICQYDAAKHARGEKVSSYLLDYDKFCWRNIDFNFEKKRNENIETSYSI